MLHCAGPWNKVPALWTRGKGLVAPSLKICVSGMQLYLYPVAMWLLGVLSRADGAFICLWLVFYSLEASG